MFGFGRRKKKERKASAPEASTGRARSHVAVLSKALDGFELPSFPGVAMRVLEEIRKAEATPTSVAEILASDPGLSVKVLRTVNSAAFSLRQPVSSVPHAVALLGLSNLESMIVAVAVNEALPATCYRGFDPQRFWKTAARRAAIAQELASVLHPATRVECFTWALLQDLAVPLLAEHRAPEYGQVLERWRAGEGMLHDLEREAFGWDHAEVGAAVCEAWDLPEPIADVIHGHHGVPGSGACPPAVALEGLLREGDDLPGADDLLNAAEARFGLPSPVVKQALDRGCARAEEFLPLIVPG